MESPKPVDRGHPRHGAGRRAGDWRWPATTASPCPRPCRPARGERGPAAGRRRDPTTAAPRRREKALEIMTTASRSRRPRSARTGPGRRARRGRRAAQDGDRLRPEDRCRQAAPARARPRRQDRRGARQARAVRKFRAKNARACRGYKAPENIIKAVAGGGRASRSKRAWRARAELFGELMAARVRRAAPRLLRRA